MLSPDTTAGTLGGTFMPLVGSMNPVSPPDLEASAVKGGVVLTPTIATTKIAANERTFVAVSIVLFFLLFLRLLYFISVPSTNIMGKGIPLLIGQVTQTKIPRRRDPRASQ